MNYFIRKKRTMQDFYPRAPWMKFVTKAPIFLWRLGLGPISGRILMLITTSGRKSGLPRRAMVEYHILAGKKYAPSGFGDKAQWYKNIMANPRVTIQTADGTERMRAVRVSDDEELLAVYELLKHRNPPFLNWYLQSLGIEPDPADLIAKKDRLHILRFDPTDEATPPGLDVDWAWLWPLAILGLWLLRSRRKGRK